MYSGLTLEVAPRLLIHIKLYGLRPSYGPGDEGVDPEIRLESLSVYSHIHFLLDAPRVP